MLDFSRDEDFQRMSSGYSCYDRHVEELLIHFTNWSEAAFSTVL